MTKPKKAPRTCRPAAAFDAARAACCARRWLLPAVCLALALVYALGASALRLAVDSADRASGRLAARSLTLADFTPVNAVIEGDTVTSLTEDPQLLFGPADTRLDRITLRLAYNMEPFERCLYYTTAPGEDFSWEKRVWPIENGDGTVTFILPRGAHSLRLDPGSRENLQVTVTEVQLNEPRAALDYFVPSAGQVFALLVPPLLAAGLLQWLAEQPKASGSKHQEERP